VSFETEQPMKVHSLGSSGTSTQGSHGTLSPEVDVERERF
jgi:hypothetical protein